MDNKEIQEPAKNKDIVTVISETDESTEPSSRFSRRRFIRSAAISSPILLSIKSPSAWAGGYNSSCSITSCMSGNASHPQGCQAPPKKPDYWDKCLRGKKEYESVRNELNKHGCYHSTAFHSIFSHNMDRWKRNQQICKDWKFKVNVRMSDDPSLLQAIGGDTCNLYVQFKHVDRKKSKITVNLLGHNAPGFHKNLLCGYFNGVFHPTPVNYICDSNTVRNAFILALNSSINHILRDLDRGWFRSSDTKKYAQHMSKLVKDLNTWDDYWNY